MTIDTAPPRTTAEITTGTPGAHRPPADGPGPDTPRRTARDDGPAARLVALPQLEDGLPPTLAEVDEHLARLERARQAQLDALPPTPDHVVAAAHRRIVARFVDQVRDARARIRTGTYGTCAHCGTVIPARVLDREPWQDACTSCDPGVR
ncbi:hypothetical protein ASC64_02230 [Nocardioides sp. Root122]|uniref:hypothetical protein n=1 Tax=Nocardioides TaxID=1839 RepID=UPI000702A3F5|nr:MULTISPECIES: hypothetical protein [Nocardioides]KQV77669.1 hypothetical protein ASC64_02230 [Nocardioides sp. Root122]MCK9822124.1 hypothetical protein [Nocardioides cavernae]